MQRTDERVLYKLNGVVSTTTTFANPQSLVVSIEKWNSRLGNLSFSSTRTLVNKGYVEATNVSRIICFVLFVKLLNPISFLPFIELLKVLFLLNCYF